jgi:hypothetical protein
MTWWLWCFTASDLTYYLIDRCRGSPLLRKFFKRHPRTRSFFVAICLTGGGFF